jgi:uncharacterized protein (DUF58 family)
MALTFHKRQEKQKYLFLVFSILILAAFSVLYFNFFKKQKISVSPPEIYKPPKIEINLNVLKSSFLKGLLPFEEIKPFEDKTGRENPFLPYSP